MLKNDKPPKSKDEAQARRVRPPPDRYDPDKLSHWSITMTLAWIIWREIDAVRNEWDDYRNECADWRFEGKASARAKVAGIAMKHISTGKLTRLPGKLARLPKKLRKDFQKGSWHFHQWEPSGWRGLCLRVISENLPPQAAIDELWLAAGEGRIKATAIEYENAKAFSGCRIEIPAHYWPDLKRADDPSSGKAMLSGPDGRVYREVQFSRLDGKKIWPKSPPLSRELLEHVEKPEPEQTRPAERELLEPKARPTPTAASKKTHPQSERAERYIKKHYPDGTDGVSTTAIRRKFVKDKDLQAELEKEDTTWGVPSAAVIDRVLARRQK
jgi:hypothetical protein